MGKDNKIDQTISIMKKSEELIIKAREEDNDLKALSLKTKAIREERVEDFTEFWLPTFKEKFGNALCYNDKKFCYTITLPAEKPGKFVHYDFYVKANKVLVRHKNVWHKPGLHWLINNLLK